MPLKSRYFKDGKALLDEAEQLVREDVPMAEDESTLTKFYNGRSTWNQSDANDTNNLTNHLLGFDNLNTAKLQLEAIYTKSPTIWKVNITNAPQGMNQRWSDRVTTHLNRIIRESRRFREEWKSASGDLTLVGRAAFVHCDRYDWCPKMMRPLVPRGTGIMPDDVPYAVIPGYLTVGELKEKWVHAESYPESKWHAANLKKALEALKGNVGTQVKGSHIKTTQFTAQEIGQMDQEGDNIYDSLRMRLPVFYCFENLIDDDGERSTTLTIIARFSSAIVEEYGKRADVLEVELYHTEDFCDKPSQWLHPFFVDCQIGGSAKWHTVMGLGRLNYDLDMDLEVFFNAAMTGSRENLRRLFTVTNAADTDTLQQFLASESNLLPEGVQVAEVGKNGNFQYAFQVINMLQGIGQRHANSSVSNTADKSSNELEVQAMERQARASLALGARMEDIYECFDALGSEIFERFLSADVMPLDKGYKEIKDFQDCLKRDGIPIEFFRSQKSKGKYYTVKGTRAAGNGDRVAEIMINRMLLQNIHLFAPQAQEMIKRRIVASETGDHQLASELVPDRPSIDPRQVERANTENHTCYLRGIAEYVPPLNDDDMHLFHIPEHMGGIEGMLARGGAEGWTPADFGAFKSLGAHTVMHISAIAANPNNRHQAQMMMQKLQQYAQAGEKLIKQMAAKQEQSEMTASEKSREALGLKKLEIQAIKENNMSLHRLAQTRLEERKMGTKEVYDAEALALKSRALRAKELQDTAQNELSFGDMKQQQYNADADRDMEQEMASRPAETEA
jgi:hypothetical protein